MTNDPKKDHPNRDREDKPSNIPVPSPREKSLWKSVTQHEDFNHHVGLSGLSGIISAGALSEIFTKAASTPETGIMILTAAIAVPLSIYHLYKIIEPTRGRSSKKAQRRPTNSRPNQPGDNQLPPPDPKPS